MSDPKATVTPLNAIDPSDFRVPASDAKGHSIRKHFRMMPVLSNAIGVIIGSQVFPYKTESELIRHAIMRHIRWLESVGDIPSVSGQANAANKVLIQDQLNEEYKAIFVSLRTRVNDYLSRNEPGEARRVISDVRHDFDSMPEGYWKNQYLKGLAEWDYLFDNAPKVKLLQFAKE